MLVDMRGFPLDSGTLGDECLKTRRPGSTPARHGLRFRADRVSGAFTAKTLAAAKAGVRLTATHGALAALRERPPGNADTRNPDEAVAAGRPGAAAGRPLQARRPTQRGRCFHARLSRKSVHGAGSSAAAGGEF
jgi:hypothetical protein